MPNQRIHQSISRDAPTHEGEETMFKHISLALFIAFLIIPVPALGSGKNYRVSVHTNGSQGDEGSFSPAMTPDGRYVAFFSEATNLVSGDNNGKSDVFVHDRWTDKTVRININPTLGEPNNDSYRSTDYRGVSITPDGRYVAFHSKASNLVPVDTNFSWDCFVHDRDPDGNGIYDEGNGTIELVSVDTAGNQYATLPSNNPWISADARFVVFESLGKLAPEDTNINQDIYLRDRALSTTMLVSKNGSGVAADDDCWDPVISGNGRFVAYASEADNLVGIDNNNVQDIFLFDRLFGSTILVSVKSNGDQANGASSEPSISDGGTKIAFTTEATNLHAKDNNGLEDVYLRDTGAGTTTAVSRNANGFTGDDWSIQPSISPNGRYVAFCSIAEDLTPENSFHFRDVFVYDLVKKKMSWFSESWYWNFVYPHTDGWCWKPSVSNDGERVAFESGATNMVLFDTNDRFDVFVRAEKSWHKDFPRLTRPQGGGDQGKWIKPK
jgi:Tol biopolymer transport system component